MSPLPAELDRLLHDLRGPLNSAVMHLEVLRRAISDDPGAKASLDTLHEQLQRLAAMLPAAFDVVALELGPTRTLDLREVATQAVRAADARDVTVEGGDWPSVLGDERLLVAAVTQLLRNAVEATRAAPTPQPAPRLSASVTDGQAALSVRDWGPGVKSTNLRVIARLTSTPTTVLHPRGEGLLATERIARLHGGGLRLLAPGDGTEVILTLPLAGSANTGPVIAG